MSNNDDNALNNAAQIIERFGGIRPMAAKIDAPVTTVQGWKKRDVIPGARRDQVIKAASENNIDISDLTNGAPVSNQNTKPTVHSSVPQVSATKVEATKETDERPARRADNSQSHDAIMAAIEENSRKTMVTTVWIVTGLILFAGAVAAFLLIPTAKEKAERLEAQSEKIVELENEVENVSSRGSFVKNLVPDGIQEKMDNLQNQAQNIQNTVTQLSEKAEAISNGVIGENAGPISKRIEVLEEQIGTLTNGDNQFSALMERIGMLEESVAGQEQLKKSMDELRAMMDNKSEQTLSQDLQDAQGDEEGALGQTLEGVSNTDLKAAAMLIAFSQMRNALYRQEPFENDLAVLQRLAGKDNVELQGAIERLAPHADKGVLSPEGLSQEFKGLTGDIVFSSLKGEDVSIKEKAQARIHNVFKFEKDGELVTGTPTQQTVSKAQALLDKGDIQGAIQELQGLDGEAAQTALPFIQEAQTTLLAEQVQKMLGNTILSKFTNQLPIEGMLKGMGAMPSQTGTPAMPTMPALPQGMGMPDMNGIKDSLGNAVPMNGGKVVRDPASGMVIMPKSGTSGFDMEGVKKTLEKAVPATNGSQEVIKDEQSGVTILPKQPSFKGFSAGE